MARGGRHRTWEGKTETESVWSLEKGQLSALLEFLCLSIVRHLQFIAALGILTMGITNGPGTGEGNDGWWIRK